MNVFLTTSRKLRNTWWVTVFFWVLAVMTLPTILVFQHYKWEITIAHQAMIVTGATWICQLLRRKSFAEVTGTINAAWFQHFFWGLLLLNFDFRNEHHTIQTNAR